MRKSKNNKEPAPLFELKYITPANDNQAVVFNAYAQGKNISCHGFAGTGKTFISLYLALKEVLSGKSSYDKIIIIRSVVQSRDMGFLPGSIKEKIEIYEEPYREICDKLFGRGDGYQILKLKNLVKFTTTSFLRGITFDNAIVIVDEIQNMNYGELSTVMTRLGDNTRVIFCGDYRQTDLQFEREKVGLKAFLEILRSMENFEYVDFQASDIVRSGVVKNFIITEAKYRELHGSPLPP